MALKFKTQHENKQYFNGKDLLRELRSQGVSRDKFAERLEEITGIRWYPSKVVRMEQKKRNYVTKEEMQALQKALQ